MWSYECFDTNVKKNFIIIISVVVINAGILSGVLNFLYTNSTGRRLEFLPIWVKILYMYVRLHVHRSN